MIKNKTLFLAGASLILVVGFAVAIILKDRGVSDVVAVPQISDDSSVPDSATVQYTADGYSLATPQSWYVEKATDADTAVYPDYDPAVSSTLPSCKIEISNFAIASGSDPNAWITAKLHEDPTADVREASRTSLAIGGSSAIEWQGTLNGVTTTLVYALANGKIFEIAPSTLSDAGDATDDDCDLPLQILLDNLHFKP